MPASPTLAVGDVRRPSIRAVGQTRRRYALPTPTPDGSMACPVDQTLAAMPSDPAARERRRRMAVAGADPLRRVDNAKITLVGVGVLVTETLTAADRLAEQGLTADVVCVTSPGLVFEALQARRGHSGAVVDPRPGLSRIPCHAEGDCSRRPSAYARIPHRNQQRTRICPRGQQVRSGRRARRCVHRAQPAAGVGRAGC